MKGFVLWLFLLFSAAGMTLMFLGIFNTDGTSLFSGFAPGRSSDDATVVISIRKLKEITPPSTNIKGSGRSVDLDDYLPIDPAPSSKASVQPGPIEHGTPLMPFIPKPPPTDPSKEVPLF